jgi:hypothetical protein
MINSYAHINVINQSELKMSVLLALLLINFKTVMLYNTEIIAFFQEKKKYTHVCEIVSKHFKIL